MKDQIVQRDEKRKNIKTARRRQIIKRLGAGVSVLAVIIVFLLVFQIREIRVEGNDFLTENEVTNYIRKQGGEGNMLAFLIETKLSGYTLPPTVKSMKIHMVNPWTVQVKIKEKQPIGYAQKEKQFVYFDEEGTVLGITDKERDGISKIEGLDVSEAQKAAKLKVQDADIFEYIVQIQTILGRNQISPDRIVCDGENITLYFGKVCAMLGSGDPEEKVSQLPAILPKLEGQSGTLHLEHYGELTQTIRFEKTE